MKVKPIETSVPMWERADASAVRAVLELAPLIGNYGSGMKSVGEVMGIGRAFERA